MPLRVAGDQEKGKEGEGKGRGEPAENPPAIPAGRTGPPSPARPAISRSGQQPLATPRFQCAFLPLCVPSVLSSSFLESP